MLYLLIFLSLILLGLTVGMTLFVIFFGRPFFGGAPYAPTKESGLDVILKLAEIKPGDKVCDLGSGDGRIVIAAARAGAEAHGYEINPYLVWQSRRAIKKAGLSDRAFIHRRSYWQEDLSRYQVVIFFGITYIMKRLEQKFDKELQPGTRVIANFFTLPTWQPVAEEKKFLLYRK